MSLKEEIQNAEMCGKTFILPHKLNEMQKTASKVVDLLLRGSTSVSYGYEDMKVIMKIVDSTLEEHLQDGMHEHTKEETT